ncbi:MAG: ABC transporter permease [Deltaproteobacteria bacterium HGW-Deltaproteobacteria-15]|jgi:ABC-2 type transport system permease protein|nr:MAG: ABC transporter permease [Deltaproteobacteria bacterium HGW-Deltaproteobacteria-15]
MLNSILAITCRIYSQLLGDKRFLALAVFVPLIIFYLFKVFIRALPVELFTNPEELYILITAFIIHFTSYVLCLIVIVRERRDETLSRMFVNNFNRSEIVIGYILGYAGLATLQAVLIMLEVAILFELSYTMSMMLSLFAVMWVLSLISIALGIMFSNLARTEAQIFPFIPLFILPTIFLSGLLLPMNSLPWSVRWLGYLIPFTYAQRAIKPMIAEMSGIPSHLGEFAVLILYGILLLVLSSMTLKQRE